MIVKKTTPEQWQRVNELFAIAFEQPMETGPAGPQETGICHWAAFQEDGSMMSTLSLTDYTVQFDGHPCPMAGVGGVASLPQYRRMGGIRGCFEACLPELYEKGYLFSYLYAFSNAYYRKFGFESCVQKQAVEVDLSLLHPRAVTGRLCLCEIEHPFREAIRELDRFWEDRYNMMVIHTDSDYDWTGKFDPAGSLTFTYVYLSDRNIPKAYTTFRMENQADGRNLLCSRFCFRDREGFDGLMNLFQSLSADHRLVKFELPAGQHMEYLLPEWSLGAVQRRTQTAGMVRVIHAEEVLRKAAYDGTGALTLQLLDPQIPRNQDCFRLVFRDGRAVSLERGASDPDLTLTIAAFSALITGTGGLEWMSGVEIHRKNPALSQVFRCKPLMITDFF